ALPEEKHPVIDSVNNLTSLFQKYSFTAEELGTWYASISSYSFWAKRLAEDHDSSRIIGQDNILRYRPHKNICFRIQKKDTELDILRVIAAALSCGTHIDISWTKGDSKIHIKEHLHSVSGFFHFIEESEGQFIERVKTGKYKRVRLIQEPGAAMQKAASESFSYLDYAPVLSNGRYELLHFLREINFSIDYHRYGNLGMREGEERKPLT
ncbi:MAG: proline dehydrogenase, partial [Candidatus Melainabacteria bacterium]|nr:proline dehydrogenase [Candidatus Melainabacteria bacterium]